LQVRPEDLALRIPVYVGPTATVMYDGHPYSMPPEAISMPATLYLYADRVRIVADRWEAVHPRKFAPHEGSTLAEHRAALVAAVSGKRGKRYLKRQQLLDLGAPVFLYLTEIVHRQPKEWISEVDRLYGILERHGSEVLLQAVEQGLQEQVFSAAYVEQFLQRSLAFEEVEKYSSRVRRRGLQFDRCAAKARCAKLDSPPYSYASPKYVLRFVLKASRCNGKG